MAMKIASRAFARARACASPASVLRKLTADSDNRPTARTANKTMSIRLMTNEKPA